MAAMLGQGLYTFKTASKVTGLSPSRIREWFRRKPIFQGDYLSIDGDFAMSFLDLVDVFVAGNLRNHGVTGVTANPQDSGRGLGKLG